MMGEAIATRTPIAAPNTSGLNIIPFAIMAGGWLGPPLMFWAYVWGPLRPFSYPEGDLFPNPIVFFAGFAGCVALWWMPRAYFRVRGFEKSGRLYEALGVRWFRRVVPDGDVANRWQRRRHPNYRVIRGHRSAAAFLVRTEQSERGHLVLFAMGLLSGLFAWHIGWGGWAVYFVAGNLVANVYPILLQRYTRARLASITDAEQERPSAV